MIIKLASGKDIVIDDVARDPRVEGIDWLRRYKAKKELELKARRQAVPGSPVDDQAPVPLLGGLTLEQTK